MTCTFYDCEQEATREVTWMGLANGFIIVGPVVHPYCRHHAERMHESKTTQVVHERVLSDTRGVVSPRLELAR